MYNTIRGSVPSFRARARRTTDHHLTHRRLMSFQANAPGPAKLSNSVARFGGGGEKCALCTKTVYAAERMSAQEKVYHLSCFRCSECNVKLGASNWCMDTTGTLWCSPHFMQAMSASGGKHDLGNGNGGSSPRASSMDASLASAPAPPAPPPVPERAAARPSEPPAPAPASAPAPPRNQASRVMRSSSFGRFGGGGEKCNRCGKLVYAAEKVTASDQIYHTTCFRCTECNVKLGPASWCMDLSGGIYCKPHFVQTMRAGGGKYDFGGTHSSSTEVSSCPIQPSPPAPAVPQTPKPVFLPPPPSPLPPPPNPPPLTPDAPPADSEAGSRLAHADDDSPVSPAHPPMSRFSANRQSISGSARHRIRRSEQRPTASNTDVPRRTRTSDSAGEPASLAELDGGSAGGGGGSARGLVVLGVCGSLRAASTNGGLLRAAGAHVRAHGGEFRVGDISQLPLYSQDLDTGSRPPPPPVAAWRSAVAAADALVFASPEHNYSISAALKNAIDWASAAPCGGNLWAGKTGAVLSAGGGAGGARGQLALRQIAAFIDVSLLNAPEVAVRRFEEDCFDQLTGDLASSKWDARVGELVGRLMALCMAVQQAGRP